MILKSARIVKHKNLLKLYPPDTEWNLNAIYFANFPKEERREPQRESKFIYKFTTSVNYFILN